MIKAESLVGLHVDAAVSKLNEHKLSYRLSYVDRCKEPKPGHYSLLLDYKDVVIRAKIG